MTPLEGGRWHANHLIAVVDGAGATRLVVLRRWARPGWRDEDPDFTVEREVAALELLAGSPVPVPRVIAADPCASACDVPALLLAWIEGTPPAKTGPIEPLLAPLAGALVEVHAVDARGTGAIPAYERYYAPTDRRLVERCARSPMWTRALELTTQPPPDEEPRFIHRDYHPGNTLWTDTRLSAVIDWTQASLGSPSMDVGHMRWNLAVDHGIEAADRFLAHYESVAGVAGGHDPYWDIVTALDVLPQIDSSIRDGAADLCRLERYVAELVSGR